MTSKDHSFDKVLIVGAGPSGLLLALLLAQHNIPSLANTHGWLWLYDCFSGRWRPGRLSDRLLRRESRRRNPADFCRRQNRDLSEVCRCKKHQESCSSAEKQSLDCYGNGQVLWSHQRAQPRQAGVEGVLDESVKYRIRLHAALRQT